MNSALVFATISLLTQCKSMFIREQRGPPTLPTGMYLMDGIATNIIGADRYSEETSAEKVGSSSFLNLFVFSIPFCNRLVLLIIIKRTIVSIAEIASRSRVPSFTYSSSIGRARGVEELPRKATSRSQGQIQVHFCYGEYFFSIFFENQKGPNDYKERDWEVQLHLKNDLIADSRLSSMYFLLFQHKT